MNTNELRLEMAQKLNPQMVHELFGMGSGGKQPLKGQGAEEDQSPSKHENKVKYHLSLIKEEDPYSEDEEEEEEGEGEQSDKDRDDNFYEDESPLIMEQKQREGGYMQKHKRSQQIGMEEQKYLAVNFNGKEENKKIIKNSASLCKIGSGKCKDEISVISKSKK